MLTTGTIVHITTTNGGEITAVLLENYRPTYHAVIKSGNGYAIIDGLRIKTIHATQQPPFPQGWEFAG